MVSAILAMLIYQRNSRAFTSCQWKYDCQVSLTFLCYKRFYHKAPLKEASKKGTVILGGGEDGGEEKILANY